MEDRYPLRVAEVAVTFVAGRLLTSGTPPICTPSGLDPNTALDAVFIQVAHSQFGERVTLEIRTSSRYPFQLSRLSQRHPMRHPEPPGNSA